MKFSISISIYIYLHDFCHVVTTDESIYFEFDLSPDYYNIRNIKTNMKENDDVTLPRVVGWELNERGKPGPRIANMSSTLDHRTMIGQSVDLNISLMKWRLWPSLETQKLSSTKVLLIGAGTLGCAVARTLLGWGIRNITLIDNGIVSYSNPSRQCLFEYQDCVSRKPKAQAARDSLLRIFPDLNVKAVNMSVPMPGHRFSTPLTISISDTTNHSSVSASSSSSTAVSSTSSSSSSNTTTITAANTGTSGSTVSSESTFHSHSYTTQEEMSVMELDQLIATHDVVFTLTDSRESRWLPTVICQAREKLLINVALGFDSYLVMRHGLTYTNTNTTTTTPTSSTSSNEEINTHTQKPQQQPLGCYFCSDIVAAMNSLKDRTLDQQCTVTRPGLSFIAAGVAVEMMVSLLQSPLHWSTHPAINHSSNIISSDQSSNNKSDNKEDGEDEEDNHSSNIISSNQSSNNKRDNKEDGEDEEDIIPIPHQIRGSLKQFNQIDITVSSCNS